MIFIESQLFTRQALELLGDELYADLQEYLSRCPEAGDVIADTGGLRKLRWMTEGRGKRGGTRVIYYHVVSPKEKKVLREINANW
jgi:hypothetical protein